MKKNFLLLCLCIIVCLVNSGQAAQNHYRSTKDERIDILNVKVEHVNANFDHLDDALPLVHLDDGTVICQGSLSKFIEMKNTLKFGDKVELDAYVDRTSDSQHPFAINMPTGYSGNPPLLSDIAEQNGAIGYGGKIDVFKIGSVVDGKLVRYWSWSLDNVNCKVLYVSAKPLAISNIVPSPTLYTGFMMACDDRSSKNIQYKPIFIAVGMKSYKAAMDSAAEVNSYLINIFADGDKRLKFEDIDKTIFDASFADKFTKDLYVQLVREYQEDKARLRGEDIYVTDAGVIQSDWGKNSVVEFTYPDGKIKSIRIQKTM